jgi:predicted secreted hydrolase
MEYVHFFIYCPCVIVAVQWSIYTRPLTNGQYFVTQASSNSKPSPLECLSGTKGLKMMGKLARSGLVLGVIVVVAAGIWWLNQPQPAAPARATIVGLSSNDATKDAITGFARAYAPRAFSFPLDHGPHLDYQTEWWYYTGNLTDAAGRHFGYQLTFFRRALAPPAQMPARQSDLATSQIYFAHFAMTDSSAQQHVSFERFSRGAGGLAGANAEPFHVFLEDWSTTALNAQGDQVRLKARNGAYQIELNLRALKPPVKQGDNGLSTKSTTPGNASYYYSFTRMDTAGILHTPDGEYRVTGSSWMDHEWSTSALGLNAQGWDWFALQLSDQRELMFYQFRNRDGSIDPVSSGTLVAQDGSSITLRQDQVKVEVLERWQNPQRTAEYPVRWRISIPSQNLSLDVTARLKNQQMDLAIVYWEGTVEVSGQANGAPINGVGYVELTGYSGSLNGRF